MQVKETRPRHTKLPQILRDVPGAERIQYIQENDLHFIYLYVYGCEYTVSRDILRASKDYGFFFGQSCEQRHNLKGSSTYCRDLCLLSGSVTQGDMSLSHG